MTPHFAGITMELLYHPFYCEENVWHLCQDPRFSRRSPRVVFVSNRSRAVAMWHQRAGRPQDGLIVWDYHVVLLVESPLEIWDLDTTRGAPVPALAYVAQSFHAGVPPRFLPMFRCIDAAAFVERFSSDRSHMRLRSGRYRRPPPPWAPILPEGIAPNLMQFVNMNHTHLGEVHSLDGFVEELVRRSAQK